MAAVLSEGGSRDRARRRETGGAPDGTAREAAEAPSGQAQGAEPCGRALRQPVHERGAGGEDPQRDEPHGPSGGQDAPGTRAAGGDHGTGVGPPLPGSTHPARHRRFGGNEAGGEEGEGASVSLAKAGARRYS